MELLIEQLAPYLPYGIQAVDRIGTIWDVNFRNIEFAVSKQWKPLLKPFDDALKIEEFTDLFSDYSMENLKISFFALGIRSLCWKSRLDLEQYEWLLKNSFDVFGLIDKGLAVSTT